MKACVVGGGLAGACAAMALREGGAEVELIGDAPGASALGGGTLDFAGALPLPGAVPPRSRGGRWLSPAERVAALLERNPHHPYHRLIEPGEEGEAIAAALRRFGDWFGKYGATPGGDADRPLLVGDTQGTIRVGDAALETVAVGSLADLDEVALVAVPGLPAWDPSAVGERLTAESQALRGRGLRTRLVEPHWPDAWCEVAGAPARLAALLDEPGALPVLREALRDPVSPGALLLFPPVLGLDPTRSVPRVLGEALGRPVGECVGLPPLHLAGQRLQRALDAGLEQAGVRRTRAGVRGLRAGQGDEPHLVELAPPEGPAETRRVDVVVLATGRFVGGGLREGEGGLEEPLLGLPLESGETRGLAGRPAREATRADYFAPQPLFRAGVAYDAQLRPRGAGGRLHATRLFVAGDLLAGFDAAADRSGHGVALLSGMAAARHALRAAAGAA